RGFPAPGVGRAGCSPSLGHAALLQARPGGACMASTSRQLISQSPAPAPVDLPAVIPGARPRLDAVDAVRGLIMAFMALDHTRDFFSGSGMNPRDVHDAGLFLTRFVTHFCAPGFVFLAGVSAFLHLGRGRSSAELGRFLLTRGLWLMLLE